MKEQEIISAYCKIREIDCSIPDNVLDFMKYASIKEINSTIPFLSIVENVALANRIKELQATIEAQEIIIKDKSAIMEAMAQPKTCDGCKYSSKYSGKSFNCSIFSNWIHSNAFGCSKFEPKVQP